MEEHLAHRGILGQKWGIRRTKANLARQEKKDAKWAKTKGAKVTAKVKKSVLADQEYNMGQVRNGVNASGRIAYKQEVLSKG